jgi:hypothetical protein
VQLFAPVIAPWLLEQLEIFVYVLKNQHPTGVVYVQLRSIFADQSQTFFVCASYGKRGKKGRIVHFLRLPPQKDEIGRGPGEGSKHRTLSKLLST